MRVVAGRLPLRLSLIYAAVAGVYIVISDRVVATLGAGSPHTTTLQTVKGVAFVCVTATIILSPDPAHDAGGEPAIGGA